MEDRLKDALCEDAAFHWIPPGGVVPVERELDAVKFLREYVAQNRPVIIEGLVGAWPASTKWDQTYLSEAAGDCKLHVNFTPRGHGDCILEDTFVKPLEIEMTMHDFFDKLQATREINCLDEADRVRQGVPYLSHQNDNLREELPFLMQDVPPTLPLAEAAFGPLEACNLWIGDERAVSSMHLDHFENFYAVVEGEKVFHLLPPCFHPTFFMREASFPAATWAQSLDNESGWEMKIDQPAASVPWIPFDPVTQPDKFDQRVIKSMIECRVRKGQLLYLPAMWLHRATQACLTISVNYWFDMAFDHRWVYHNAIGVAASGEAQKGLEDESDSAHNSGDDA